MIGPSLMKIRKIQKQRESKKEKIRHKKINADAYCVRKRKRRRKRRTNS